MRNPGEIKNQDFGFLVSSFPLFGGGLRFLSPGILSVNEELRKPGVPKAVETAGVVGRFPGHPPG
jgi:hypothetical protein